MAGVVVFCVNIAILTSNFGVAALLAIVRQRLDRCIAMRFRNSLRSAVLYRFGSMPQLSRQVRAEHSTALGLRQVS